MTRPVLIVQLRLKDEAGKTVCEEVTCDPADHVLFATDFSEPAERAFTYVEQIVRSGARRFTLLHVQDKGRIYGDLEQKIDEPSDIIAAFILWGIPLGIVSGIIGIGGGVLTIPIMVYFLKLL